MSTASRPYPIVQDLIESFAGWLKHRRELNEMRQLDRSDFDRIANDLRIAPDDLEELVRHGQHAADELPQMLEQLGIDERPPAARAAAAAARHGAGLLAVPATRHNATASSPTAPPWRITTAIAAMPRRWNRSIAPTSRRAEALISRMAL